MINHADPLDAASERSQQELEALLASVASQVDPLSHLPANGRCHNCGSDVDTGRRFCDQECSEEYTYFEKRRKANVRVQDTR